MKRNLLRRQYQGVAVSLGAVASAKAASPPKGLEKRLSSSEFPLSFQSPMSAILACEYEPIAMSRRSLHMSNWIVCDAIGVIGLALSLQQLTIYFLSSKSSSPQRNQE